MKGKLVKIKDEWYIKYMTKKILAGVNGIKGSGIKLNESNYILLHPEDVLYVLPVDENTMVYFEKVQEESPESSANDYKVTWYAKFIYAEEINMENKTDNNTISWDFPTELMDEDGYPTQEALDYIKNWSIIYAQDGKTFKTGMYFGKDKYDELIEYIKTIWVYNNAIVYEDGLLEIHTYGWSGNEDIIDELKKTDLWLIKHRVTQSGGHFYFEINNVSEFEYLVIKKKRD